MSSEKTTQLPPSPYLAPPVVTVVTVGARPVIILLHKTIEYTVPNI